MQNLQLSNNVKKYFVNALKGLGLRSKNSPEELSSMAIANLLDNPNTTPFDIYCQIRLAVLQRLRNDAFTTKALQKDTAFNRNTVKLILNNLNVNSQVATNIKNNSDELLRDLSASGVQENGNITSSTISLRGHVNEVVENVIVTLMSGVPEQNLNSDDSNHDEKQQAVDLWQAIRYSAFQEHLIRNYGNYDENKFNAWVKTGEYNEEYARLHQKFHVGCIRSDLIAEVKTRFLGGGTDSEAEAFLNTKIQGNELKQILEANGVLLKDCELYCQRRCQTEQVQYDKNQLTLFDVLAAAGSARPQIITFFQERSQEQKQDQIQNPSTTEVKKENKIGNVMGNAGRAFVKEATGIGTNVDFDEIGLKGGRKGPWRGYKSLFESILRFFGGFYERIPSISFVQNLMARDLGYSFAPEGAKKNKSKENKSEENKSEENKSEENKSEENKTTELSEVEKEPKQPWKTDFKDMPKEYYNEDGTFNLAGEFYNKTKARMLRDKMIVVNLSVGPHRNEETQSDIAYLQTRIATADLILQKGIPDPASPDFNNPLYYIYLEEQILAEEKNKKNKFSEKYDRHANANNNIVLLMADVFRSNEFTPNAVKSRREKAKILFNLENKFRGSENFDKDNSGEISNEDLDAMIQRFTNSGEIRQLYFDLNDPTRIFDSAGHLGEEFEVNAVDALSVINKFVENDLQQNAMKQEYDNYVEEQIKQAVKQQQVAEEQKKVQEREKVDQFRKQIHDATVKEMNDGGMTM